VTGVQTCALPILPISSLDLQRWNKSEGGGLSADQIRALLNATGQSGDQVSTAMQTAATRIIDAIKTSAMKSGLPMDKISKADTIPEAVNWTREALLQQSDTGRQAVRAAYAGMEATLALGLRRGPVQSDRQPRELPQDKERSRTLDRGGVTKGAVIPVPPDLTSALDTFTQMLARTSARAAVGGKGLTGGGGVTPISDIAKQVAISNQVTVSALPIKANFSANISVMLNGAIVARALMPIMYQMLAKLTASTGTRPKGTMR